MSNSHKNDQSLEKHNESFDEMFSLKSLLIKPKLETNEYENFDDEISFVENRILYSRSHWIQMHKVNVTVNF